MRIAERILSELAPRKPNSLLAEGVAAQALARDYLAAHPECRLVATATPADAAIACVNPDMEKLACYALIGQLKQMAPVVLIAADNTAPMDFGDYLALGMQRLVEADEEMRALYVFDLHTYKPAPDWLNAKYWANPELWKP
jgi:hypothetical protein